MNFFTKIHELFRRKNQMYIRKTYDNHSKKFYGVLATDRGLEGIQRISVQFTIDKTGRVTDFMARATHQSLEKEAKRAMTRVAKMQPGKQSNNSEELIYSLPTIFRVQN